VALGDLPQTRRYACRQDEAENEDDLRH
jgi:hypothetical protein